MSKINEFSENLTDYVDKMNSVKSEISDLRKTYQRNKNDLEEKMKSLNLDMETKQFIIDEEKKQNEILKQELLNITSSVKFTKSNNEKLTTTLFDLKSDLKDKRAYLEETKLMFQNKINTMKIPLSMQIKKELKLFEDNVVQLKKQHQDELGSYNAANKTYLREFEVKQLIEIRQTLNKEIQAFKLKINEQGLLLDEKNKKFEQENETKFANLQEQTHIFMNEIARVHQVNEKNRSEKLAKMKAKNSAQNLELFRLKTQKLSTTQQLKEKLEEYNKIKRFMDIQDSDLNIRWSSSKKKRAKFCQPQTASLNVCVSDNDDNESEMENAAAAPKEKKNKRDKKCRKNVNFK